MKKTKEFLIKHKYSIPITLVILAVIGGIILISGNKKSTQEFVTAKRLAIVQKIDVTGRVVPAQEVALAIESGGTVSSISTSVGQQVSIGQTLLRVDSSDLQIRLGRQQAALEKAKITLAKQEPKTTSKDDLVKAYEDGFNAVADAFLDLPGIITGLDNILDHDYLLSNSIRTTSGEKALDRREIVDRSFYTAEREYRDILKKYQAVTRESDKKTIEALIVDTYESTKVIADTIKTVNNFVDFMEDELENNLPSELATDQTNLDSYTDETNSHLTALLDIKDTIEDSQIGIVDENLDITSLKIDIRQAELDIQDTLNQIRDRSIVSPINGTVTNIESEVGETISAGNPVITIISSNQYQIEANLPEADMAKVKIGAPADVILDAYGSDVIFQAKVVSINPAETIIDGVATYKTTIQFVSPDDRIKSGMTADITINGDRKENVIGIPQRAVIIKDEQKVVQVLVGETITEKPVKTGMRGTDGNIEITEGIVEGDKIVVFIEEK